METFSLVLCIASLSLLYVMLLNMIIMIITVMIKINNTTSNYRVRLNNVARRQLPFLKNTPCVAGAPLFSPLSIYFVIFSPFYTFLFLSLALLIFFFCPSLSFLPE